jgi:hypothetical protein
MYLKPSLTLLIALTGAIAMSSAASAQVRLPHVHIFTPTLYPHDSHPPAALYPPRT